MKSIHWLRSLSRTGLLGGFLLSGFLLPGFLLPGFLLSIVLVSVLPAQATIAAAAPLLLAQAPLEPTTQIRLTRDRFNVRIVNQARTTLEYTAAGDTPTRSLARGSEVLLRDLRIPASLLFDAIDPTTGDRLFFNITVQAEGEANGLKIILRDGAVNDGNTSVFVDAVGAVFVD